MGQKLDKKILIHALKIAVGTSVAMYIAQVMNLQNATSAGTIALLTIMTTKWETVRLSIARIITFAIAVLLALFTFSNLIIPWEMFGIYIFFLVLVSEFLGWKSTISVNAVIGTHFVVSRDFSPEFITNEFMLVLIGTAVAFVVNLFSHNRNRQKRLVESIHAVEATLQMILKELASYLMKQEMKEDVWRDIRNLENRLKKLVVEASEYEGNTFQSHTVYYMDYFEMRLEQCTVLHDLHYELKKIRSRSVQAEMVANYMLYLAEHVKETNVPAEQIKVLEDMVEEMGEQPLPVSRDEMETRVVLYHILTELETFLIHKRRFVQALDDKRKRLYWKEKI